MAQAIDAADVAALIQDGAQVISSGSGGGLVEPDGVFQAIEQAFLEGGHPRDLTYVHALGMGDRKTRGTNRFAHQGMVRRVIGGHWIWSPEMLRLAEENEIEAYCFPSGAISLLFREIGARRPGLITHVGLGTFADPELGGGKCNARTHEDLVEKVSFDGRDYLRYKPFGVDVGIIRGTYADADGNVSCVEEPADLDNAAVAMAARNSGGIVIAQVRERVASGSLRPREVTVTGNLVDYVLVVPDQQQTYRGGYDLSLAGLADAPQDPIAGESDTLRRIVARRAADELFEGAVINFGFGMSAGVAEIIARNGTSDRYWVTIEQGIHGGELMMGDLFGIAARPMAIVPSTQQFDLYSGGGLDITFLGMAEMDAEGNVNVSQLGGQMTGPGGFIDISQGARKVVFCGRFDAKGTQTSVEDGKLLVRQHGQYPKLIDRVASVTFSGPEALARGQEVIYVTERATFRLAQDGVEIIEIAPGIDLERDVLAAMEFTPIVRNPALMRSDIFDH
ncbi:acyl CoA:acetate/3-ketoacid CoA transferase [Rhodovibrio salinarum]|uniref:Acetate CoA-transferase YdiF n=1 Tax=Rhodovibrio salinarum TaxID=1087 RepID=A0A934V097_9PROT|nr:CoA-transferase [Rhodovibrio salinarum]MBK1697214.1 acyl CoA:acetate/3-ketoacid CoA transferase [Rhodovibrio salinarum]